jgi:hypothetical protein
MYMFKTGSPTGNVTLNMRKTSDDSVVGTFGTHDVSTLTGSATAVTKTPASPITSPNENFYLCAEYSGGDAGNNISLTRQNGNPYAGGTTYSYTGSWSELSSTDDVYGSFTYAQDTGYFSNAVDNNTATSYESASTTNPWLRVELSAGADKEPSAVAVWTHANTTATDLKIQTSPDGSTWTDKRRVLVSALTHGAYNYIRFNRDIAQVRYLRFYAMDGGSVILAIAEVKTLSPTESQWNRRHGHKTISASDTSTSLSG